jgi:hypothetical protein
LYGYWQSASFFEGSEEGVRKQFNFPNLDDDKIAAEIKNTPQSVAIHIRRGDYVSDPVATERHLICDMPWYKAAWNFVRSNLEDSHAFVFSDDPAWVRDNLNFEGNITIVENMPDEEPWKDMARMSLCEHYIISNSSYSWWAAYLSNSASKMVVAPKYWFNGVPSVDINICPDDWILR